MGDRTWERSRGGQTRARLSPLHQALPLAIRMEGNTVDRSEVTLDSSKLFFKGQVEEPGRESRVGSNSSFSLHLLPKHINGNHSPNKTIKQGNWDKGEMNAKKQDEVGRRLDPNVFLTMCWAVLLRASQLLTYLICTVL